MILTHLLLTDLIDTALDNGDGAGEHGVDREEDVIGLDWDHALGVLLLVLSLEVLKYRKNRLKLSQTCTLSIQKSAML